MFRIVRDFVWVLLAMGLGFVQAAQADSRTYRFEWVGGGGYVMQGALAFDSALSGKRLIFEKDLTCFEIVGFAEEKQIGRWALGMLTPDTTWRLTFDPHRAEFLVYGRETLMPQAWNMDGVGENCGTPGFGFNIGSAAQDLCVDGTLIVASQVAPPRPFPAKAAPGYRFSADACLTELLLGQLQN